MDARRVTLSFLFFLLLWSLVGLPAAIAQTSPAPTQTGTQTVKGRVLDQQSKFPLPGVQVAITDIEPIIQGVTDADGYFKLNNVPVGRHTVRFRFLGYGERMVPNVLVNAGKENVLNMGLEEAVVQGETVELVGQKAGSNGQAKNEFAGVSARTFNAEETWRYAGSRADPARMATNFAGVSGANDGRNDIIIRGNSPTGLLWRMEGTDIPNPSHFGSLGATGGPVGMLNNNVLDRSDFMTSAFPAEYGNAMSGVFDLSLRNGNNEKHEFLGQVGFNGFELGAEGPLRKGGRGSYLINYRYSTLGVFNALGINFGTGSAVPEYQDVNFKVNLPIGKKTVFTAFGFGGISAIKFRGAEEAADSASNLYTDTRTNSDFNTSAGMVGTSLMHYHNSRSYSKLVVSGSAATSEGKQDSLNTERNIAYAKTRDRSVNTRLSFRYTYNNKISNRLTVNGGAFLDQLGYNYRDSVRLYGASGPRWRTQRNDRGATWLVQGHVQGQYRFTDAVSANLGVHYQRLTLNGSQALEPRASVRWQAAPAHTFSAGYGLHSQIQQLASYYYQTELPDQTRIQMNRNLGLNRSHHFVLGHQWALTEKTRLKTEVYYQHLFNVPINTYSSSFSILNAGADFSDPNYDSLSNSGLGRNYGMEFTLERNFNNGYYFLSTLSVFQSKYRGSDGVWRNTVFNTNTVFNLLAGKEWNLNSRTVLALDGKQTISGGRRYTPINEEESRRTGRAVYYEDRAFSEVSIPYLRTDLKLTLRRQSARATQEIFVDVQNIFNRQNVYAVYWDPTAGRKVTVPQLGLFPVPGYRLTF